jgi:hypothetical protein
VDAGRRPNTSDTACVKGLEVDTIVKMDEGLNTIVDDIAFVQWRPMFKSHWKRKATGKHCKYLASYL